MEVKYLRQQKLPECEEREFIMRDSRNVNGFSNCILSFPDHDSTILLSSLRVIRPDKFFCLLQHIPFLIGQSFRSVTSEHQMGLKKVHLPNKIPSGLYICLFLFGEPSSFSSRKPSRVYKIILIIMLKCDEIWEKIRY